MSRTKELVKNTIIITIGKFSTQIVSFFLLPLYTTKLSTDEYGNYDLIATIAIFLVPLITMLLEESMFRFLIDVKTKKEKEKIITHTFLFIIINSIIFSMVIIILTYLFDLELGIYILLYTLASTIVALSNALSRGEGRIKIYSFSNFLLSILTIILSILFILVFKLGFKSLILSYTISNLVISLLVLLKLKVYKYISIRKIRVKTLKEMLSYSVPLVPNTICWSIINVSDRLFISEYIGVGANGVYSISNKFPNIINNFYNYFNTAWRESSAKIINDGTHKVDYPKIFSKIQKFIFSITILLITFMPLLFIILIDSKFKEGLLYIPILCVSVYYSSLSGYYGGIFTAFKNTKILGITSLVAAIINLFINILFIKKIGIFAAAISTLFSSLFLYYSRKQKCSKFVDIKFSFYKEMLIALAFLVISLLYYFNNVYITILNIILATIISFYLCKNEIMLFLKRIKRITIKR